MKYLDGKIETDISSEVSVINADAINSVQQSEIESLQLQQSTNTSDIGTLQSTSGSAGTDIADLQSDVGTLQTDVGKALSHDRPNNTQCRPFSGRDSA